MNKNADKKKDKNNQSVNNSTGQFSNRNKSNSHFEDNRPQTAIQRKLQETINNSPKIKQLESIQKMADKNTANQGPVVRNSNDTGLPDNLKSGIENLSGQSMDDVNVHYNSNKPAQLNALAYAQGTDIHLASGQEKHLPHEAWHVVQQKQGRVKPTMKILKRSENPNPSGKGKVNINDDKALEKEADVMGAKALNVSPTSSLSVQQMKPHSNVIQRLTGYEIETNIPVFGPYNEAESSLTELGKNGFTEAIGRFLTGGLKYGLNYGEDVEGRFSISGDHNNLQEIHINLIAKLMILGLIKKDFTHRNMANIEYITPPRPEIAKESISEHSKDIASVKSHLNETLAVAKNLIVSPVPKPGYNIFTGLPYYDLINWVKSNDIHHALIKTELDAMNDAMNNAVYIQETSGVLPEDIPTVFKNASNEMNEVDNQTKLSKMMSELMQRSRTIGAAAFNLIHKDLAKKMHPHGKAVIGYLTLVASYLLADNLTYLKHFSKSGSTSKNLVPFMSKTILPETLNALPEEVRPKTSNHDLWFVLTNNLREISKIYSPNYWSREYEMEINDKKKIGDVFPMGKETALSNLINKNGNVTNLITGNILGLDDPHNLVEINTGQKAIPLEDRYFKEKYNTSLTSENMEDALENKFNFAVDLNVSHAPDEKEAREEIDDNLSIEDLESVKTNRIMARIAVSKNLYSMLYPDFFKKDLNNNFQQLAKKLQEANSMKTTEKMETLSKLDVYAHTILKLLINSYNKDKNEDKSEDKIFTLAHSIKFAAASLTNEFSKPINEFFGKKLDAENLKEVEDVEEMNKTVRKIKAKKVFLKKKIEKLSKMNDETEVEKRKNILVTIQSHIISSKKLIKEAEEFYHVKPKKETVVIN